VQLTTLLVETLKSGKITVSEHDREVVEVNVRDKNIDANIKDKEFVKEIISSVRGAATKSGVRGSFQRGVDTLREARKAQPTMKELVEDLCREEVTITVSYRGDRVITVGSGANSKFTRIITGTKGVEINSPRKLAEMGI
jgi:hypothetical protein